MTEVNATDAPIHRLSPHLRGHLLLFDRPTTPAFTARSGVRLLLAAVILEAARLAALKWLHIPLWILMGTLLGMTLQRVVPITVGVSLRKLGLRPWREWTTTEKSYFLQVVILANVIFPVVLGSRIASRIAEQGLASCLLNVFLPYLIFGFYQELVYRGMVQSELVRRWGVAAGILVANVLYTFGPLHWNYFASRPSLAVPMFAAIFAIGLFFGFLYRRSGNLWMVAVFHAIGNAYIVWGMNPS